MLLDTHVVLWELAGTRSLSKGAEEAIGSATELRFSSVSFAEIGVKASIGKLTVPEGLSEQVARSGLTILPLEAEHGLGVATLPIHHRDPFDRLLISQARAEALAVVTADERFARYEVEVIVA